MKIRRWYSWTITTPAMDEIEPVESQHLKAHTIKNCCIYLRVVRDSKDNCRVVVHKTNLSPIKVIIGLRITGCPNYSKEEEDEWEDACQFYNCHCPCNETVEFKCDIIFDLHAAKTPDPPRSLLFPTENFLMNSSFSDVTIVIGDEELPAHRLILGGYSSVFCKMLSTSMKEARTCRITIEDIDLETMKTLLTLLYSGKCEALSEVPLACKVLAAAQKYDIQHLQDTCVYYLQQQINTTNVVDVLELADLRGQEQLKQVCWEFVMKNKKHIFTSDEFKNLCLTNPGIMDEFMVKMANASP